MAKTDSTHIFRIGVFGIIEQNGLVALARRQDNKWWNLPGGGTEAGESVDEALKREIMEEIGIEISIEYIVGVYSKPQKNEVVLTFWCKPRSTELFTTEESIEVGWFDPSQLPEPILPKHRQRIFDAFQRHEHPVLMSQTSSSAEDQQLPFGSSK